jgi:hypothetical protein
MRSDNGAFSDEDVQNLQNLINHIVLPPQLPQKEESDPLKINSDLVHLLRDVTKTFDQRTSAAWISVIKMLSTLDRTEQTSALNDESLGADLKGLKAGGQYYFEPFRTLIDIL